jgi:hypothetical protein
MPQTVLETYNSPEYKLNGLLFTLALTGGLILYSVFKVIVLAMQDPLARVDEAKKARKRYGLPAVEGPKEAPTVAAPTATKKDQ